MSKMRATLAIGLTLAGILLTGVSLAVILNFPAPAFLCVCLGVGAIWTAVRISE